MAVGLLLYGPNGETRIDPSIRFTNILGEVVTPSAIGNKNTAPESSNRIACSNLSLGDFWYTVYYVGSCAGCLSPRVWREGEWLVWSYRRSDIPSWLEGDIDAGGHKIVFGVY